MDQGARDGSQRDASRQFVTSAVVAEMLSLEIADVEALLESGELLGIRIGRRDEWRVERTVLDRFLEAKYEEARRAALFRGFDHASIADLDGRRRGAPRSARPESPGSPASPASPA
ncbi:helix-turn-helix domain-containing protein [Frondihabitans australicus]|uniref:Excisionase family DNA binding protein n=1 Tax=Frondihabitans australicus TaxID=386892 RepID=A0A495ICA9_9MICO|nr:helix-turn-helix domain-containing protein [Frondihabitans australicus]RKR73280.1 hypothetical protein C8E83_0370 [Frondihabitans australicus]